MKKDFFSHLFASVFSFLGFSFFIFVTTNLYSIENQRNSCSEAYIPETFAWNDSDICCDQNLCYESAASSLILIPFFELEIGAGRSYRNGYETAGLFFGKWIDALNYPFLDLRFHSVGDGRSAANAGIGWRSFSCTCEEMFGANLFYDYRHLSKGSLHQLGLGIELFGRCWDFRANGYKSIGRNRVFIDRTVFNYPDDFFAQRKKYKAGMWGLDTEVGMYLINKCCFSLYAAAGPYYYGSQCCNHLIGGMGRMKLDFNRYLSVGASVTHDRLFHTRFQGEIVLSLPLCYAARCCAFFFEPVRRNPIIVAEKICCWTTNF